MIYVSSQPTRDGKLTIAVIFCIGTDRNIAQIPSARFLVAQWR
jgi:hypothetical protein